MGVSRIDHVQLAMPPGGEDAARRFYDGVLGIREVPKDPAAGRDGCWFEGPDVKVHLGVEDDFRPARKAHPAFVVTDLDALLAAMRAAGGDVVDAPALPGWRRAHVSDPFGNRIELMEATPA